MKPILLTLTLVLALHTVQAQRLKFGIRAGANINKIEGKSFSDEFSYGYHLGGGFEMMFGKTIGIQPEVLFNQSNTQTGYSFDTLYKSINPGTLKQVKLNYLSIPILLNIKPLPFLTLQAGPQFGILMTQQRSLLEDGRAAFRSGNFSMVGGVQLHIMQFRIYGRYGVGLNNMNDIDNRDKWKSQTGQVGLAYMF
jgi:opacity protein-like surface antigen